MKRYIFLLSFLLGIQFTTMAQKSKSEQAAPKKEIKVNREYDENGNLIKFDSVYSFSWSNDSALTNMMKPEDLSHFFDGNFSLFNDSSFFGNSFFDSFDHLFSNPFGSKRDSLIMKEFGLENFNSFNFRNDSLVSEGKDFNEFFGHLNPNMPDSISSKSQKVPFSTSPQSMNEIMKILKQQMMEMEEHQQKWFQEQKKHKNQPKLEEL